MGSLARWYHAKSAGGSTAVLHLRPTVKRRAEKQSGERRNFRSPLCFSALLLAVHLNDPRIEPPDNVNQLLLRLHYLLNILIRMRRFIKPTTNQFHLVPVEFF